MVWERDDLVGEQAGSEQGLGCSSNGAVVVCSYSAATAVPPDELDNVVAYDYDGVVQWTSGNELNESAFPSAPLILDNGVDADVIAVDNVKAIRFNGSGGMVWDEEHGGGTPVSPVITDDGVIVLGTITGPISAISAGGQLLDVDVLHHSSDNGPGDYFEAHKTPAVSGERVYFVMRHIVDFELDPNHLARLVAIDVDADAANAEDVLTVSWIYDDFLTGPIGSKSRPSLLPIDPYDTCVLFDGYRLLPGNDEETPGIFAVCDDDGAPDEVWVKPLGGPPFASFAEHPGGGSFWYVRSDDLRVFRRSTATGELLDSINLDALIDDPLVDHRPCSAMTITGTPSDPVMIVAAMDIETPHKDAHVLAVHLTEKTLLWDEPMPNSPLVIPAGQFPLVERDGETRVVFTAHGPGVRAIGVESE